MEILAAFAIGLLVGGGTVYKLTRNEIGTYRHALELATATAATERADSAQGREGLHSLCLELAHKVSAPEQASIDHIFEKDRQAREQESARREAKAKADAVDATLKQYGIEADELVAPLPDPDMELMQP